MFVIAAAARGVYGAPHLLLIEARTEDALEAKQMAETRLTEAGYTSHEVLVLDGDLEDISPDFVVPNTGEDECEEDE